MQKTNHGTHWSSVLLFIASLLGLASFLGLSGLMGLSGMVMLISQDTDSLANMLSFSAGMFLLALLMVPGTFLAFKRMGGKQDGARRPTHNLMRWVTAAFFIGWPVSLASGHWAANNTQWGWLVMPLSNLLAAGLPVALLTALALNRIEIGPRWRAWGIFGLGMTLGPLLMMAAEILVFIGLFTLFLVYIGLTPGMAAAIEQFSEQVQIIPDAETLMHMYAPIISSPLTITAILFSVAVCIPIIEELLKPIGIWLFADHIRSPRQGFGLGVMSGAAYALLETLGVSSQVSADWSTLVIARGGTSLLHILTTGLTSWALVSAWRERKYLRLAGVYTLSVLLHSVWNALNILNAVGLLLSDTASAPGWLENISTPAITVLVIQTGAMVAALWLANRRLSAEHAPGPDSETAQEAV